MTTTIITGYTGERHITPSMDAKVYRGIFGNGDYILPTGGKCSGSMTDANTFVIMDGIVSLQGRQIQQSQETLSIATCASGYQRHDLVVMRYTHDADNGIDSAELKILQGTAVTNNNPQDPTYNTGTIDDGATPVDMPLYMVALDGSTYTVNQYATLLDAPQSALVITSEIEQAFFDAGIFLTGGLAQALADIVNALGVRYVKETGKSNGWTYTKYSDNTFEATYTINQTYSPSSGPLGGWHYTNQFTLTFPSDIAINTVKGAWGDMVADGDIGAGVWLQFLTNTSIKYRASRAGASQAYQGALTVHIFGTCN